MRIGNTESDHPSFKTKEGRRLYQNALFDSACADLLDGLRERRGILLLTGEAGVGKTFLLRRCMVEADDIRFILLTNASLDFPDILNYLCASLELPTDHRDAGQQSRLLLDALAASARRNQITTLLIDDAHHLRSNALRCLHDFVKMPAIPSQRLQVILSGLPEIEGQLRQPALHRLQSSITTRCRLGPLNHTDTASFVDHQFKSNRSWLDETVPTAVIERISQYCQGVPRSIAMLCDTILLFAGLEPDSELTPTLVDEAAKSCFLTKPLESTVPEPLSRRQSALSELDNHPDLDFPNLGLELDFELEATFKADFDVLSDTAPATALATESLTETETAFHPTSQPATEPDTQSKSPPTVVVRAWSPVLREFNHLLIDLGVKLDRKETRIQDGLRYFHNHYLQLLQDPTPGWIEACEQRLTRLQETRQPVLVSLAQAISATPERPGMFCALIINPTWWLYREIRLHLRSPELVFDQGGQAAPVRLLDGRDAWLVFMSCQYLHTPQTQVTLWLEIELCDHRGEWSAYGNQQEIRVGLASNETGPITAADDGQQPADYFWPDSAGQSESGAGLLDGCGVLGCTLPLELEENPGHTHHLRSAGKQTLNRGTSLTRALLLTAQPAQAQAPARIELVSRPFVVFGRQSSAAGTGFGDFTLGFVAKYSRISRLHCVLCALGDQLALMSISDHGYTYIGRNGQRLERGHWEMLEDGDELDICELYHLKLSLAWERQGERTPPGWNCQEPRDRFGRYLLELVEVLRQRDQQTDNHTLRTDLRKRYLHLTHMQDRVAELNGVGNPGVLLYARFERDDPARQQIVHYYVPKWLPIGSSLADGLCLSAPDVQPHHAELLFRDGMYWLQNLASAGSVRVGCHGLATNEVLALAVGDTIEIGSVRLVFEGY